jgi:uncharacterized protein YukE
MVNSHQEILPIKIATMRCESLSVNDDGRSVAEIEKFIEKLKPAEIGIVATSYLAAAEKLFAMCHTVASGARAMATVWEGVSSVEAQQSLRILHATLRELGVKFKAVGQSLQGLEARVLQHQNFVATQSGAWSDNKHTGDDSEAKNVLTMDMGKQHGSQDEMAGQHLRLLNDDLVKVYDEWPFDVSKILPAIQSPAPPGPELPKDTDQEPYKVDPNLFKGPGSGYESPGIKEIGATPSIDSNTPNFPDGALGSDATQSEGTYPDGSPDLGDIGAGGQNSDGAYPDGSDPGNGDPHGTDPAGVSLEGANSNGADPNLTSNAAMPPDTSGLSTPGSRTTLEDFQHPADWNPSTSTSTPNSGSPYAAPASVPTSALYPATSIRPGTGSGGMTGSGGLPLNAKSASVTGSGMPFLPMGGAGASANNSEEKENNTWLHQDDDVWGGDADDAVSDKIG